MSEWVRNGDFFERTLDTGAVAYIQYQMHGFWKWWIYVWENNVSEGETRNGRNPYSGKSEAENQVEEAWRKFNHEQGGVG